MASPIYDQPRRLQRILVFTVPPTALLAIIAQELRSIDRPPFAQILWLLLGCYLGRYFYNRSRDRQATIVPEDSVEPHDPDYANDLYDKLAYVLTGLYLIFTSFPEISDWLSPS